MGKRKEKGEEEEREEEEFYGPHDHGKGGRERPWLLNMLMKAGLNKGKGGKSRNLTDEVGPRRAQQLAWRYKEEKEEAAAAGRSVRTETVV